MKHTPNPKEESINTNDLNFKDVANYNSNSYFNEEDYFLIYDIGLKKYIVSLMKEYKGAYYSVSGLKYKATSVLTININELKGVDVLFKNTDIKGKISKSVTNTLGIVWDQGQAKDFKKSGFPYYWNEPKNLIIDNRKWHVTKTLTKTKV